MNKKTFSLILLLVVSGSIIYAQKSKSAFSYKIYGNVANYFENENDLLTFFDFKKGDQVAEIGAADGQNIVGFSLLTDSIRFYVQDIDPTAMNERNFNKLLKRSAKYKSSAKHSFHLCLGTETSSLLPDNSFDKILLIATFHEFTYMTEMLNDIGKKLKEDGKVYILESRCLAHKNYSVIETTTILEKHGFKLLKTDGKDLNGGEGVYRSIFGKK